MTVPNKNTDVIPWYKQGYVWLVILFPMLAVIGGIATIIIAVKSNDGLVVDDYYKKGLEINRVIERDKQADFYKISADITLDKELQEISILLSASNQFRYPEKLSVKLLNATRPGFDQNIMLVLTEANIYRGNMPALVLGKWYVHIESDDWRVIKTLRIK